MKLTLSKPKGRIRHLLVVVLFAFAMAGGIITAASAASSYDSFRSQIDAQGQKYCAPLKDSGTRSQCQTEYTNGASAVYFAKSESSANKQIQAACTPPVVNYDVSRSLSACSAFATAATSAKKILGKSYGGNTQSSAQASGSSQNSNQSSAPPIKKCDSVKGAANQKKCKQDYRDCNQKHGTTAQNQCKTNVINNAISASQNPAKTPAKTPAQNPGKTPGTQTSSDNCSVDNGCDLIHKYVNPFIQLLSATFGIIAVGSLILGAIQYITSEGDPQKSSRAKSRMVSTVFAIIAYAVLYGALQFLVPGGLFNR